MKTYSLLFGALQYVDMPGYSALLSRWHSNDLTKSGGLLDVSKTILGGTDAKWNGQINRWTFPTNGAPAILEFGHFGPGGMFGHSGLTYQYIGVDELTEFSQSEYTFLFRSLRRPEGMKVPLRIRAGTNPIGKGAAWVKQYFLIEGRKHGRVFLPSKLDDNPYIDKVSYLDSLSRLDPYMRQLLLEGNWDAKPPGKMFRREWFKIVDVPPGLGSRVRYWDLAATEEKPGKDPDWTVGLRMTFCYENKKYYIEDVQRFRATPGDVERRIKQTAQIDGQEVEIEMEQEGGASGKTVIEHYQHVLRQYAFSGKHSTGDKVTRAKPFASQVEAGNVYLVRGPWINAYLDELEQIPGGEHDDQLDASSGAYNKLAQDDLLGDMSDAEVGGIELPTPDWDVE